MSAILNEQGSSFSVNKGSKGTSLDPSKLQESSASKRMSRMKALREKVISSSSFNEMDIECIKSSISSQELIVEASPCDSSKSSQYDVEEMKV